MKVSHSLSAKFDRETLGLAVKLLCHWQDVSHKEAADTVSALLLRMGVKKRGMSPAKFSRLIRGAEQKTFKFDEVSALCTRLMITLNDIEALADTINLLGIPNSEQGFRQALDLFPN